MAKISQLGCHLKIKDKKINESAWWLARWLKQIQGLIMTDNCKICLNQPLFFIKSGDITIASTIQTFK